MARSFPKSLAASSRLWKSFREQPADRARVIDFDVPKTLAVMGRITRVFYTTTHGKKSVRYDHKFAAGSRPFFCAAPDGRIFVIGGRYRVTDRGIVDHDTRGRVRRVR